MERFHISSDVIDEQKVVKGKDYRISVITDRLFRIELKAFTDSATQTVLRRNFGAPSFEVLKQGKGGVSIKTKDVLFNFDSVLAAVTATDLKTGKSATATILKVRSGLSISD